MNRLSKFVRLGCNLAASLCLLATGCDAPIDSFEPNNLFAKRLELTEDVDLSQAIHDTNAALTDLFGTPDQPKWPAILDTAGEPLVSLTRLQQAAGPVSSDEAGIHRGLYREHCIVCHGTAGDGLGPAAALLNPYPRDFRLGKVKFKDTPIGNKPTRQDITRTLQHGIVGTSMPAFDLLSDDETQALVDYVIYLAVRGELERKLLAFAATELDLESGERLYDPALEKTDPDAWNESLELIDEYATDIQQQWRQAEENVTPVPARPAGWVVAGQSQDELSASEADQLTASIAHGRELFQGNVASCAFCHGPDAMGDGQQNIYDDWTRDWTAQAGLNPADHDALQPMFDLGALKPRHVLPRNLRLGIFRGGGTPETLYRRIVNGIDGSAMPAAPMQPANPQGLTERDVWDLVNYLLSLKSTTTISAPMPEVMSNG